MLHKYNMKGVLVFCATVGTAFAPSNTFAQTGSPPAPVPPTTSPAAVRSAPAPTAPQPVPPSAAVPIPAPSPSFSSTPLSLAAAMNSALSQISSLQQARIDEAVAAEDLRQARASLLPRLRDAFTIAYNTPAHPRNDQSSPSFIAQNAIHEYQNLIGVAGDWNFGLIAAVQRSHALLQAARAGTEVARRAYVRGVSESYYGAALATAKRRAAEQSLDAAEEFERVTDLNYRAGEVPEVDVIRARLQTSARRDDLSQARQAENIANASLGTLLGQGITTVPLIEPLPQSIDSQEFDTVTAAGVERRPELMQLAAQSRAARADLRIAGAEWLPRITYSVDEGFDTDSLAPETVRQHRGLLAMANVEVPIFEWGATRSRQRQAQLRFRGAELQRQLQTRALYLQYATAREQAITAMDRVKNAQSAIADAERNVEISVARYRAGEAPISEATDAQTTLAQQRIALQQALYDFQVARALLKEAAGQ